MFLLFQIITFSCLSVLAAAAPSPEADPHYQLSGHAVAAPALLPVPASNCVVTDVILVIQTCTPSAENVCTTQTVDTEEIEYEKLCKEVVDTICDAPHAYHGLHKREAEADAEADPHYGGYVAHAPVAHHVAAPIAHHVPLPVAHAVAHSVQATVKHACREVTTKHCVDNPKVKPVPVEVEHCHTVTKVTCADIENIIPRTTCEAVETTHVSHAAPIVHAAPVVHAPLAHGYAGYAGW